MPVMAVMSAACAAYLVLVFWVPVWAVMVPLR